MITRARTWLTATGGGMPRSFWLLWAGTLVNRLGFFVGPFLSLYLVSGRHITPTVAGLVLSCWGLGGLIGQPVGGALADRYGRRVTLVGGMVATSAAYLALGAATALPAIAAAAFAAGLVTDVYRPAVGAMVADLVSPADRPRAYALLYWAINLGVAVASVAGGALASRSYWLLFVLDAATSLVFAGIIWRAVPETRPPASPDAPRSGYAVALRDGALLLMVAGTIAYAVVMTQYVFTVPIVMGRDGLGPVAYGLVGAANPITVIVVQPLLTARLSALPPVRLFAAGIITTGLGYGLMTFAHSVPAYAATTVVWTLGEIATTISAPAIVAALAPDDLRGRYQGVWGFSWGLSLFLAPLLGTRTLDAFGPRTLWLACLAVCATAGLAVVRPLTSRLAARTPAPA